MLSVHLGPFSADATGTAAILALLVICSLASVPAVAPVTGPAKLLEQAGTRVYAP